MGARQGDQGARRTGTESALLSFFRLRFQCTVVGMRGKKKNACIGARVCAFDTATTERKNDKDSDKERDVDKNNAFFLLPSPLRLAALQLVSAIALHLAAGLWNVRRRPCR